MIPSVGRIVHYVSRGSADGKYQPECRAAIVTDAGDGFSISVCVLNPQGMFFDVLVPQAENGRVTGGTWHWPERVE